jgi:hypothetical protein
MQRATAVASRQCRRQREAGAALVLVLILLVVLLSVAAVLVRGALSESATAGADRAGKTALLCAESGIRAGIVQLGALSTAWNGMLSGTSMGGAALPLLADIDGCGQNDVRVWIRDNVDEVPPAVDDPTHDIDNTIFIHSRCIKPDLPQRDIEVLWSSTGTGEHYANQAGQGAGNAGNQNIK